MGHTIAFLSQGRLHVKAPDAPVRPVESAFANEMRTRAHEIHRRHAWKTEGRGAMFMSRGLTWGPPGRETDILHVAMTSLSRGSRPGELLYAMAAEGRTAICRLRLEDASESRLLHGSDRHIQDLYAAAGRDHVACSVVHDDGTASIALMTTDATDLTEVTEGEVRDAAPSWVPTEGRRIVYESAGIGRDAQGRVAGLGLSGIYALDLERGSVEELASEPGRDLLHPRMTADGALHHLSRPHAGSTGPSGWRLALDLLLLPVRLLHAVFQYLSFFTTRYTGKPLTTAGGPKQQGADVRQMQVWSNLLEAEEPTEESAVVGPSVPRSWQLVRRGSDGSRTVLAEGVVSYDLGDDGAVVYTTGSAIHVIEPDGSRHQVLTQAAIGQVVFVDLGP